MYFHHVLVFYLIIAYIYKLKVYVILGFKKYIYIRFTIKKNSIIAQ